VLSLGFRSNRYSYFDPHHGRPLTSASANAQAGSKVGRAAAVSDADVSRDVDACYAVTDANGDPIEDEEEEEDEENECSRCDRVGHFAAACYARTSVDGKYTGTKSRR
jgi:hypothetical protein